LAWRLGRYPGAKLICTSYDDEMSFNGNAARKPARPQLSQRTLEWMPFA